MIHPHIVVRPFELGRRSVESSLIESVTKAKALAAGRLFIMPAPRISADSLRIVGEMCIGPRSCRTISVGQLHTGTPGCRLPLASHYER